MKKICSFLLAALLCGAFFFAAEQFSNDRKIKQLTAWEEFEIFRRAYPFASFKLDYDKALSDWTLTVTSYGKTSVFYRCEGLYLPKEQLKNKANYSRVFYNYRRILNDPEDFSESEIKRMRSYGSDENRKNGAVSSKFIFDAIYDCHTQNSTERHLRSMTLWGKALNVHRAVGEAIDRVEAKVYEAAKTDKQVAAFLQNLKSCAAYNWRQIRDSPTRSFHSYGIAIDILPRNLGGKSIYWGYEKQSGNNDWMLVPLKKRWMPPPAVVKAFEDEGFIWGGRWVVWDNMHFEYHPELLIANKYY